MNQEAESCTTTHSSLPRHIKNIYPEREIPRINCHLFNAYIITCHQEFHTEPITRECIENWRTEGTYYICICLSTIFLCVTVLSIACKPLPWETAVVILWRRAAIKIIVLSATWISICVPHHPSAHHPHPAQSTFPFYSSLTRQSQRTLLMI